MSNLEITSNLWIDDLISQAILSRASDIHFEPERDSFNIRFRIDGILHKIDSFEKEEQEKLISKIKVQAGMDITDRRKPQDGHYEFKYEGRLYNIRISSLPTVYGENIVMRILNRDNVLIDLDKLGFLPGQLDLINQLITSYSGMIITTGPTGSGKTNLLYSMIHKLNKPEKNIITLEDPVEYQMDLVRQTEIKESIGFSFSSALRSVVRQDPDIIMIGEIRDTDTALRAVQSALTGILVFSSFHTFDVPAFISRFTEFGITKSVIAQSIKGIISTRLVRINCPTCKKEHELSEIFQNLDHFTKNYITAKNNVTKYYKGRGCEYCKNTGYLGRTGLFEIVYFDKDIQSAIIDQQPASTIYQLLKSKNILTLKEVALEKVISGITTFDEVERVMGTEIYQQ
jgi:type II secretory ATPase GspE/PulE/Tfp pilus assembly ATPase PilB-like protein